MKRISFVTVCNLFILCFLLSCSNHNNISITLSDEDHYYKMLAHYNESSSHKVDMCLDKYFGRASKMSFVNTTIDGDISMDDGTNFYINKKPGYLQIKFDKSKNSISSYNKLKALSEDLKHAMQ